MTEIIILIAALTVYLFSSGILKIPGRDPKEIESYRKKIPSWVRLISLLIVAMMTVNVLFRLFGK